MTEPNGDPATGAGKGSFRIGDLVISPGTQQTFRDGTAIALPRLSFDLFLTLIHAAPNTVTLEELMSKVWPGLVVSPETVTQRVKLLRDALGDDSQAPRYIGLVRGRGYRLLVPVVQDTGTSRSETRFKGLRSKPLLLGAVLLLIVIAVALIQSLPDRPNAVAPVPGEPSIAVLPFATLSPDAKEHDYFAAGVHDDLITRLAQMKALKVISRSSVLEYAGSVKNLREVARELGVAHLLEGSVQQIGDRVRINVQLIDAASDAHLWAQTYDRELTVASLLDIQTDIARAIAHALQIALLPEDSTSLTAASTSNLEAYRLYLTGNGYRQRWGDEGLGDLLLFAEDQYRRAIALDPDFALAYAALAQVLAEIYWQQLRPEDDDVLNAAHAAAQHSLELVSDLPEGRVALGTYYYYGFRDYHRALEELSMAERHMPGNSEVHGFKAYIFRRLGRLDDAVASYERAHQLAPRNAHFINGLGDGLARQGRIEEAETVFRQQMQISAQQEIARHNLAHLISWRDGNLAELRALVAGNIEANPYLAWWLAWTDGDYAKARASLEFFPDETISGPDLPRGLLRGLTDLYAGESAAALEGLERTRRQLEANLGAFNSADPGLQYGVLAQTLAGLGQKEAAIAAGRRAVELVPIERDALIGPRHLAALATVYAMFDETDLAIAHLETALVQPYGPDIAMLARDPRLSSLLKDPEFQALVEKYRR